MKVGESMQYPRSTPDRCCCLLVSGACLLALVACDDASPSAPTVATAEPALDLVIDDFEDGDQINSLGGTWYTYTDADSGGVSRFEIPSGSATALSASGEGFQSEHALSVEFSFDQGQLSYDPYVGIGSSVGGASAPLDLSGYSTLQYSYRGNAHTVRLETTDVTDYDVHGVAVAASSSWKTVELPLNLFSQEGWGTPVAFDPSHITALSFHIRGATDQSGSLSIDDLGAVQQAADTGPDMEIRDLAPPAPVEIDSVAIDNPLQELAMESLDRGYNITNWLEEGRFDGFDYDEDFVASLANAGFESVRLPIDLDLYVEETSGSGADLELTLHDDLFDVLDAFDEWTEKYGLSFTIDYHQYDRSLDFSDADSNAEAVALWGKVAAHFADNPRSDLFFELLNEPELSAGGTAPTQEQWTNLAEDMIAAIRSQDTKHSIIFGDVEWYGITPLSKREPLSDDKVIYSFHFYEPFVFTHQGASWANMGTTHDIPFPYSPERWSDRFADLGVTPSMESWILSEVRNYYRTGSRQALFNRIVAAKQWAVDHDVPVICNEFGVYDATSRLEDRVRYYSDLIGIFNELEIPWQHWFMILQADADVLPEYREAFGLE